MYITFPTKYHLHRQTKEVYNGIAEANADRPEKIENIRRAMESMYGDRVIFRTDLAEVSDEVITAVHSSEYVQYMKDRANMPEGSEEFLSTFDYTRGTYHGSNATAQRGVYASDTYTAFTPHIWEVARDSYRAVHTAGDLVLGGERFGYALTRPPGHHAMSSMASGYCYLSNMAIYANHLADQGVKVGILDIDYHHGNGAQMIFYEDDRVITTSLHADPERKFPYYTGYAHETGRGRGAGKNLNIPLPAAVSDDEYLVHLQRTLDFLKKEHIEYLIVGLGFDTYERDLLGDFAITLDGYARIGKMIADTGLRTLFVQEGGYNIDEIGDCAASFFRNII